jgi:ribonucleoside-triphosphate reductase
VSSLPTDYQSYIHLSRYARWDEAKQRRETWDETVDRYINFFKGRQRSNPKMESFDWSELRNAIINLEVMPSMRCMMTAGKALEIDNVAGFNCSYCAVDSLRVFDEILYVLMCGTGVGFSVERQFVNQLPALPDTFDDADDVVIVEDSKYGWANGLRKVINLLWEGKVPTWDTSRVRPAGARLRTFGGRASGPEPLVELFKFTIHMCRTAAGRKLTSLECHDLVCKIADIVVVGGVRRSALISLSNLSDDRMRHAKSGQWWQNDGHRALANNSVAYTEKPEIGAFMREWVSLFESKSGERGIFNRVASKKQAAANHRRDANHEFGTNPCSEIILRSKEFCNLSEVIVRTGDTEVDLARKVRLATILGTLQATLVDFVHLSPEWRLNTMDEALLGVSMTGLMDHSLLSDHNSEQLPAVLSHLREHAVMTNRWMAQRLGIKPAAAVTCVKPSGTVSQLVDSASGMHERYAEYYLRTVRADKKDPLSRLMRDAGVYVEDDVTKPNTTDVFYFPMQAPSGSSRKRSALEQLKFWKIYQLHWCEHKPSITVYVKDHEWMSVGAWVFENFDILSGVSFLPHNESDTVYKQAPYQQLTKAEYDSWVNKNPKTLDWSKIGAYEAGVDSVTGTRDLACSAGVCEIL